MVRIYFAAWKNLILHMSFGDILMTSIGDPTEVINNFWNGSLFCVTLCHGFLCSCFTVMWRTKCFILCSCFCCKNNENRMVEIFSIFMHSHYEVIEVLFLKWMLWTILWLPTLVEGTPSKGMKFQLTMEIPSQNHSSDVNYVLP